MERIISQFVSEEKVNSKTVYHLVTNYRESSQNGGAADFQRKSIILKSEAANLKDFLSRKPSRKAPKPNTSDTSKDKSTPLWDYMTQNDVSNQLA